MRRTALQLGLIVFALGGCHPAATVQPDAAPAAEPVETVELGAPRNTVAGIPHGASIQALVVAPEGTGALSLDKAGSVRLWPSLDGAHEPLLVPGRGPRAMSLASRSDDRGGTWVVGLVDSAGGTHVMRVDPRGQVTPLFERNPFDPARSIAVLPGSDRVLLLGEDHRLRLLSDAGEEVASLAARGFRPVRVLVNPSGQVAVLSVKERVAGRIKGEVQRLEVGPDSLRVVGSPVHFESATEPDDETFGLSPDGGSVAYLHREGAAWHAKVRRLDDGHEQNIDLEMQDGQVPALGFVGADTLLVTSRERGTAWLVDVAKNARRPRITAHQPSQPMPVAHQAGMVVVGYGTWLAVQRFDDSDIDYLGYRSFVAQSGAISPSGNHIAWAVSGDILIEPADLSREPKRLRPEGHFGTQFIAFADEDHIVGVGTDGSVRLYHWKSGEVVDEVSLGTALQAVHFDLERGLILGHRLWGDAAVVELNKDKHFAGPYLVADGAYRMGMLSTGEPGIWTVDASHKRRIYRVSELRGDLSQQDVADRGETLTVPGGGQVMLVEGEEISYQMVQDGQSQELHRRRGNESPVKVSLGAHRVNQLVMSPDRTQVVAVADSGTLLAFDTKSLEAQWTFASPQMLGPPRFSSDGRQIVYLTSTGAAVLNAKSGEVVLRRCGAEFGMRKAAPMDAFSFVETPSFCE